MIRPLPLVTKFVGLCQTCFGSGLEISLDLNAIPVCASCLGENKPKQAIVSNIPHHDIVVQAIPQKIVQQERELVVTTS